jgi:hypothetical protein
MARVCSVPGDLPAAVSGSGHELQPMRRDYSHQKGTNRLNVALKVSK